jgi:hypothetical protein
VTRAPESAPIVVCTCRISVSSLFAMRKTAFRLTVEHAM